METEREMESTRAREDLKVVCVMFLFWGALFILVDPPRLEVPAPNVHNLYMNPFCLSFFVSAGLWFRWVLARQVALVFTWLWLFGAILSFLEMLPIPFVKFHGTPILPGVSQTALHILIIPFLLAQIWQRRVLKRGAVVELFSRNKPQPPAVPSAISEELPRAAAR